MSDWQTVYGSQENKPSEIDTTSSDIVIYQRRNIEQVEFKDENDKTYKQWKYEERTLTKEEFDELYTNHTVSQLSQLRADVDFLSAMTGTDL